MASPSPVMAEGDAPVPPKNSAFGEGSSVRRPGRLRVMHPHVADFLRSPRRLARTGKKPAPAEESEAERARYVCAFEDDEDGARGAGIAAPGRLVWGKVRHHSWYSTRRTLRSTRWRTAGRAEQSSSPTSGTRPSRGTRRPRSARSAPGSHAPPPRAGWPRSPPPWRQRWTRSRRVEAGLSCRCGGGGGKGEAAANRQVIDNAGIREGACGAVVDAAFARGALRGEALVGYVSALATAPLAGADRVDLAIATAQLEAFTRWRGSMRDLPEYSVVHGIDGVAVKAAPGRTKRGRSSTGGGDGDGSGKRRMSRSSAKGNAARDGGDYEALELEDFPQPIPRQMSTKIGKLMSRAAQQMSLSPVILRANGDAPPPHMARCPRVADKLPPMNNGDLNGDPTSGAVLVNERRPAAEMEFHVQVGLVLNFTSANAVPSTGHLTMIFSRFGPVKVVRAENSTALVIFKKGVHAEEAFSATAKISSISSSLISFRLTDSLPAEPIDPSTGHVVGSPAC